MLQGNDISVWYPVKGGIFGRTVGYVRAVDGVNFVLGQGETLAVVGESGCGKSTLARGIMGLEPLHKGELLLDGEVLHSTPKRKKCNNRVQLIFQDPYSSLNPRMTAMELITEGIVQCDMLEGKSREDMAAFWMTEVGLKPEDMNRYPHEFSGGQRQRISIARAVSMRPDYVICDEPVSALDASVQAQVLNLLLDLKNKYQLSYLFISHDLNVVRHIADHVLVMYLGRVVECGGINEVFEHPRHPYTKALLSAVMRPGGVRGKHQILSGEMPSPVSPPSGCAFHPRCPISVEQCRSECPMLKNGVACWHADK